MKSDKNQIKTLYEILEDKYARTSDLDKMQQDTLVKLGDWDKKLER